MKSLRALVANYGPHYTTLVPSSKLRLQSRLHRELSSGAECEGAKELDVTGNKDPERERELLMPVTPRINRLETFLMFPPAKLTTLHSLSVGPANGA